ncbi:MAG: MFS transporter, partial [Dehalococcoidia bacterium]
WLGDAVDKRRLMTVSMGIMGVSVFLMGQTVLNLAFFIPFMLVYAVSWGGMSSMIVPLRADYFGRRNFATIQGFMSMVQMVGMVTGPLLTGVVVDVTGSYELAFQGFLIASLLGAVAIYLARPPAKAPGARPSPSTTSR